MLDAQDFDAQTQTRFLRIVAATYSHHRRHRDVISGALVSSDREWVGLSWVSAHDVRWLAYAYGFLRQGVLFLVEPCIEREVRV